MLEHGQIRPIAVLGPLGEPITRHSLPGPTERWTARRKADVVAAVNGGLLSVEEACELYCMSVEELVSWMRTEERLGMRALRATCVKRNRDIARCDFVN